MTYIEVEYKIKDMKDVANNNPKLLDINKNQFYFIAATP